VNSIIKTYNIKEQEEWANAPLLLALKVCISFRHDIYLFSW